MSTTFSIRDRDLRHLWHPYTNIQAFESGPYRLIDSAEGVYLHTADGKKLLDGISSWWAVALGHGHPRLVEAIRAQAGVLQHSILGNMSHPKAVELAERLASIAPKGLTRCYFASDGASATEAALKIAIQYWYNRGVRGKHKFIALRDGYHGDTLGVVGVGYVPYFHAPFEGAVCRAYTAASPHCTCCQFDTEWDMHCAKKAFASMEALAREHRDELAGIIVEPLCQGAAGMRIYPAEYLRRLRALCDGLDLLLIADEIATGFGRTGRMFACELAGITPDLFCLGKALTGGYLPMSAVLATGQIYDAFRGDDTHDRTFYDGHTYCGNPITSALALATLDVFEEEKVIERCAPSIRRLHAGFAEIASHPSVHYAKTLGMIGMCAFTDEAGGAAFARRMANAAFDIGLFIRPLGEVLYLWPPLVTSAAELDGMIDRFQASIEAASP